MGLPATALGFGVWFFRGAAGRRESRGAVDSFEITWLAPRRVRLVWSNGDEQVLEYDFLLVTDTTRQVALCTRDRAVFAFEDVPLVRVAAV